MGNTLSSWGGQKKVASIIDKAGLPLQIDSSGENETKRELSRFTRAYTASGWFTGVKSTVIVPATPDVVYSSLATDLHEVFTPMSECHDEIREDDKEGKQTIFRIVRIPFKVAFVTGNLKLRLNVANDLQAKHISLESAQEGRLITKFVANFCIKKHEEDETQSVVDLDAKVDAKSLPPPPFKNMVKDVMVSKMDSCMVDLVDFHKRQASGQPEQSDNDAESMHSSVTHQGELPEPSQEVDSREGIPNADKVTFESETDVPVAPPAAMHRQSSQGFDFRRRKQQETGGGGILAAFRRSLSTNLPQRRSFETRRSLEKRRQMRQRQSLEQQQQAMQRKASASALHGVNSRPAEASKPPLAPLQPASKHPPPSSQASVFERWQQAPSQLESS